MKRNIKFLRNAAIALLMMNAVAFMSCSKDDEHIAVTGISIEPATLTLVVGGTHTLTATLLPDNAANKTLTWTSSATGFATVDASTGKVTAIAEGAATITATTANGKSSICIVTVIESEVPVTGITVMPATLDLLAGDTYTLAATVVPDDADNKNIRWSSNNTDAVTVDENTGEVTAVAKGVATITAAAGGKSATCIVTVTMPEVPAESVAVVPDNLTLNVGAKETLTATVAPDNVTDKTVTWTSNATDFVTVNAATGEVTAVAEGASVITATTVNGKTATCNVTVSDIKDVYVAGYENNGSHTYAKLWKNGVAQSLEGTAGTNTTYAKSVFVLGSDVYVSGSETNGSVYTPRLWKNGALQSLASGSYNAEANAVYVSGSDVYAAGYESNGTKAVAKVWKNGVSEALTDGTNDAYAYSISVSNSGDVYVAGYESNGSRSVAKVWKNGTATPLTDGTQYAYARSVYVSGDDVYVAGEERKSSPTAYKAKVWKNGTLLYELTDGSRNAYTYSVYVSNNGDVYAAGWENNGSRMVAKVWKNGSPLYSLTDGVNNGYAYSVYVSGSDVYTAGYENNGTNMVAKVWKNEDVESISSGSTDSRPASIFVK
ncbi:MAG: Ig-like domain-containing protein [Prevotellaceae bacterium]|jgi:uncharacterized protein YjdB|nr:Ig-like domain-containing protein [Prevotellaceae bacterium]